MKTPHKYRNLTVYLPAYVVSWYLAALERMLLRLRIAARRTEALQAHRGAFLHAAKNKTNRVGAGYSQL